MSEILESHSSPPRGFLTVPDVAERLGMTTSGVHKLIQRDKLKAIKRSERKTLVPEPALDAFIAKVNGSSEWSVSEEPTSLADARHDFETEHGVEPESWIAAWKEDRFEDNPQNMSIAIHALAMILEERESNMKMVEIHAFRSQGQVL